MSQFSLLSLPRELRDEIISYLILPGFVYTSSEKPNTADLHRWPKPAATYVDTRIYLPCRVLPVALSVCRQLREECLQYHTHLLHATNNAPPPHLEPEVPPNSTILAERLGKEDDDETERNLDHGLRITLEAKRHQRSRTGYFFPSREELSPRLLALLPLMNQAKKLKLIIWAGYDWWTGSRPRALRRVNGRLKLDTTDEGPPGSTEPDAVSFAVGKILEQLPNIEELELDILSYVSEFRRGDMLPHRSWEHVQYWLDGPIAQTRTNNLKRIERKLGVVWYPKLKETFYRQLEVLKDDGAAWTISRKGDMRTKTIISLADSGELVDMDNSVVDEQFERAVSI